MFHLIRDLIRLLQVSYAAYSYTYHDLEPNKSTFSLPNFCQIIKQQSRSYLPINLSHELTNFESLHWNDIGGYEDLKSLLRTMIQDRLYNAVNPDGEDAKADAALGLRVPKGILLHGPPVKFYI